jgi:hypothetical protein
MAEAPKPTPTPPKTEPPKSEAKAPQASSTYSAQGNRGQGDPLVDPRGDTFLKHDEIHALAGDIGPGELGLLKLDEEGHPQGTVIKGNRVFEARHNSDDFYTTVISPVVPKLDDIVTPSGAPITKFMNPDPVLWDAGMLARNPPPPPPKEGEPTVYGGGVVNTPVRV